MRIPLIFSLLIINSICFGQARDFTSQFIADSTGIKGFREKSIVFDSLKKATLVDGKNLKGYSKNKILKLLGKPNSIDTIVKNDIYFRYLISSGELLLYFKRNSINQVYKFTDYNDSPITVEESFDNVVTYSRDIEIPREARIILRAPPLIAAIIKGKDTIKCFIKDSTLSLKDSNISLSQYIFRNAVYPDSERKEEITGTVYLSFILAVDGTVSAVEILRGPSLGAGLNKEAVRLITSIPK
jgi:hypothetical protein